MTMFRARTLFRVMLVTLVLLPIPAPASETVHVSDIYMPYQVVGYSIGFHSNHRLAIDIGIDLGSDIQKRLPLYLRAELVLERGRAVAVQERRLDAMSDITRQGHLEANGRRWKFDELFAWDLFCEGAQRTMTASGQDGPVSVGDEEVDFHIRVGVLADPPLDTTTGSFNGPRPYLPDSIYQTPKPIRLVCGELAPLPRSG